jgi:hypothetical protein
MKLQKRTYLFSPELRKHNRAAKAFHASQRKHPKQPMPARQTP